jgi:hypothetical protein
MTEQQLEPLAYEPPEVVDLGPVEELTLGPGGSGADVESGGTGPVPL